MHIQNVYIQTKNQSPKKTRHSSHPVLPLGQVLRGKGLGILGRVCVLRNPFAKKCRDFDAPNLATTRAVAGVSKSRQILSAKILRISVTPMVRCQNVEILSAKGLRTNDSTKTLQPLSGAAFIPFQNPNAGASIPPKILSFLS